MKLVIGTTLLLLLAGAPGYAQEPDKDKPKEEPRKQEEPKKPEEPRKGKQDEPKPQEKPRPQEKPKQEPAKRPDDHAKPAQQNDRAQQQQPENNRNQQKVQQDRAQEQQRAQQTQQHTDHNNARPANGNVRRVPEEKFHASFGREHHFHVQRRDDRRFQYSGFWFTYSDPWPGDWDYNDDVYIDDVDGEYYLYNPRHPGVRILVIVAD
jgi:outer membrane biosynthesis protein TonB